MRRLLVDIETSPNKVWAFDLRNAFISADQIIEPSRMLCWGAKWYGEPKVTFRAEWDGKDDYLLSLWNLLDEADAVIHYNGKRFDVPRISGEFYTAGLRPPSPFQQVDLWSAVSKRFDFPSEKLAYVLNVSKLPGKLETGGFKLWRDVLAGDSKARAKFRRYNIQDVRAMEPLYDQLLPWLPSHPNMALDRGGHCCTRCGSVNLQSRGVQVTHVSVYQRYQCQDCGGWSRAVRRDEGASIREVAA